MQGLWAFDKIVEPLTIFAIPQSGTAAYDELDGGFGVALVGSAVVNITPVPRDILEDEEPDEAADPPELNAEQLKLGSWKDNPSDIVSFSDSPIAYILGGGSGNQNDFPHAKQVEFFQGRLVLADFSSGPQSWADPKEASPLPEDRITINFSQAGSPFIIKPGSVAAASPIEVTLFTRSGQTINWLLATDQRIFIGLDNEIVTFTGEPFSAETISSKQTLNIGTASDVYPIQDNSKLVFVSQGKGGVFGVEFNDAVQGFQGLELSRFAYHLVDDISSLHLTPVVQGDPAKRLWCLKDDGTVACMAVLNEQDPRIPPAWSRVELADSVQIKALVSDADELYGIIEDPSNSNKHAVMQFVFEDTPDFVFDMREEVTATTDTWTVTNDYLDGKDVFAAVYDLVDGSYVLAHTGVYSVSSGSFTTDVSGDRCKFGLAFNSKVEQFDTIITDAEGSSQLRKHKIVRANIYLKNTRQVLMNNKPLLPSTPPAPGDPVREYTGTVDMLELGWDTDHSLEFTSSSAYNFTILGLSREVEI
jgi:hypothetical protein